jgi:hypothetical protein
MFGSAGNKKSLDLTLNVHLFLILILYKIVHFHLQRNTRTLGFSLHHIL